MTRYGLRDPLWEPLAAIVLAPLSGTATSCGVKAANGIGPFQDRLSAEEGKLLTPCHEPPARMYANDPAGQGETVDSGGSGADHSRIGVGGAQYEAPFHSWGGRVDTVLILRAVTGPRGSVACAVRRAPQRDRAGYHVRQLLLAEMSEWIGGLDYEASYWTGQTVGGFIQDGSLG